MKIRTLMIMLMAVLFCNVHVSAQTEIPAGISQQQGELTPEEQQAREAKMKQAQEERKNAIQAQKEAEKKQKELDKQQKEADKAQKQQQIEDLKNSNEIENDEDWENSKKLVEELFENKHEKELKKKEKLQKKADKAEKDRIKAEKKKSKALRELNNI